ncbi:dihydroxyacetone kinase family protein [Inquilinus sp. NPDC058860]|uniref:dihydroxyacetone kinase family protein n=1 Tax=Inquilinus sp. NPDC058860 TaxID=3346652 RepID=UPI0036A83BDF
MKKLINNPRHVLREMLEGFVDLHAGLALLEEEAVVVRADLPVPASRPVALLSGGGSGHEPAHAGYVGPGLLTGAVAGDVFTSPSVDAVLAGIRAAAGPLGAVLVVKNYTGDRLNFGLAAELAQDEGIPVEIVVVADDVALRDTVEPARRRGIAGTVLIHKLAGAAIAAGRTLAEVAALARAAAADLGTMGVALGACTVPTAGKPGFTLGDGEIELGLGIHGEAGVRRGPLQPADELVAEILQAIVSDRGLARGDRVALLVNGLGATPPMELSIVARAALADLAGRGIAVERAWAGNFLTALDMPGCSLSLLKLDDERIALLDAPAQAPAWPGGGRIGPKRRIRAPEPAPVVQAEAVPSPLAPALKAAGLAVADALVKAEPHLTDLDSRAGDGDLGASMVRAAEAIRALPDAAWADPSRALAAVGDALRRAIGGSSGPFYATALLRASRRLAGDPVPAPAAWAEAFTVAVEAIGELGGAKPGDRTMLDALHPATEAFSAAVASGKSPAEAWGVCVAAAAAGTDATARMMPRLGRASYLGERAIGVPDAGAAAVLVWLEALKAVVR